MSSPWSSQVTTTSRTITPKTTETVFAQELSSSSSDPSISKWSSLILQVIPESSKITLFKKGRYDPGDGEICGKYIALSDSDVLHHQYYKYPAVLDPGIKEALLEPEPRKIYGPDGQELYLELCEEFKFAPVADFHRGLLKDVIDLRYYCVNPAGLSVMCAALAGNTSVQRLDLTSSFLSDDSCIHLAYLLANNKTLRELILAQCRIGSTGLDILASTLLDCHLHSLDLSKNKIEDGGTSSLAEKIKKGARIKKLNLSYNGLAIKAGVELAKAFHNSVGHITHLNLSWNEFCSPRAIKLLTASLAESHVLKYLNLSWNGINGGPFIADLLLIPTLETLDLSHNKLTANTVTAIASKLKLAKKLHTLDLSGNPLSPTEAFHLLQKMKLKSVKLNSLLMDGVDVTKEFATELKNILSMKHRANATITYGRLMQNYTLTEADMKTIVMRRLYYLGIRGPRKGRIDIPAYFLMKRRKSTVLIPKQMMMDMKLTGSVQIEEELVNELPHAFPGPKIDKKSRAIDLESVVDFIGRMWPEAKAPTSSTEFLRSQKRKGKKLKAKKNNIEDSPEKKKS